MLALTEIITRYAHELEKISRHAVFNVMSNNREDHAKNFSFIMDCEGKWRLSPAYDVIFSSSPGGQQSTMVLGEGRNPTCKHLKILAKKAKLNEQTIVEIIDRTQYALGKWKVLAREHGVSAANINLIGDAVDRLSRNPADKSRGRYCPHYVAPQDSGATLRNS